jgi:formylglycine-generating enzyme required for sulfatase activity
LSVFAGWHKVPVRRSTHQQYHVCSIGRTPCSGNSWENPYREITLDAFYIDKYEVTAGDYAACVTAGNCTEPSTTSTYCSGTYATYNNWDGTNNAPKSGREDHPVNCVDWSQASDYCAWIGKSLPTEAQWEKAARGTDGRKYPWGNDEPTADHAVYNLYPSGSTAPVGSKEADASTSIDGASPYGAMDMAGNVFEWTRDWYSDTYYYSANSPATNPENTTASAYRPLRGGSWLDSTLTLRSSHRFFFYPSNPFNSLGFRCAQ